MEKESDEGWENGYWENNLDGRITLLFKGGIIPNGFGNDKSLISFVELLKSIYECRYRKPPRRPALSQAIRGKTMAGKVDIWKRHGREEKIKSIVLY